MGFRPATYARYSSDLQRPASIEDQQRRCAAEIDRRGWPVPRAFSDSEISGTVAQARSGYQALLAAARAGDVNVIVVDELSRLTRDPEELAGLRKRLKFWRCELVSILDGVDTVTSPAAASAVMLLSAYRNEAEIESTARRTHRGLDGRVRAGMHAGGAIYGYRTRAVHADRPGDPPGTGEIIGYEYVIHEEEARIIRLIFCWYADGLSCRAIAAKLNEMGIGSPGRRWRDRRGLRGTWSHSAIQGSANGRTGILNNEKYIGRLIWNRTTRPRDPERDGKKALRINDEADWTVVDAPELRIVPQELWDRVKARQQARSCKANGTRAVARTVRLLSGFLRCEKCGGAYSIRGAATYRCQARYDRGKTVCDSCATVPAARAEKAVLSFLGDLFGSDGMMTRLVDRIRAMQKAQSPQRECDRAGLQRQLVEAEREAARLVEAVGQGVLLEQLTTRMRQVQARIAALKDQIAESERKQPEAPTILPSAVQHVVENLHTALGAGETEGLKAVLRALVERIEVRERPIEGRKRPAVTLGLHLRGDVAVMLGLQNFTTVGAQEPGSTLVVLPDRPSDVKRGTLEVGIVVGGFYPPAERIR